MNRFLIRPSVICGTVFALGMVSAGAGATDGGGHASEVDPRLGALQSAIEHNDDSLCHLDPSTLAHQDNKEEEDHYDDGDGGGHGPTLVDYYNWGFEGPLGQFDRAQLQRGFAVYTQVCSSCHGIKFVGYRHLQDIGIPTAVLASYMQGHYPEGVQDENFVRTVGLQDNWPAVTNAVNGAIPPDLSTIVRQQYKYLGAGTDKIFNLMLGYPESRQDENPNGGVNCYFKGETIAMAAPITRATSGIYANAQSEGLLSDEEMAPENMAQYAADVAAFLAWTSDPNRNSMNRNGLFWLLFFSLLSIVTYFTFRAVARKVHADQEKHGGPWHDDH